MVATGFNMKALSKGEYKSFPGCNSLHVNHLELTGFIINIMPTLAWASTGTAPVGGYVFNICANNTPALSWMKNMVHDTNPTVYFLVRFLMEILVTSGVPCILQSEHIPGEENVGAEHLPRPTMAPAWASITMACPAVKLCRH
jgi:hypothetical protein